MRPSVEQKNSFMHISIEILNTFYSAKLKHYVDISSIMTFSESETSASSFGNKTF